MNVQRHTPYFNSFVSRAKLPGIARFFALMGTIWAQLRAPVNVTGIGRPG